jgi:hypothetical protein
MRTNPKLLWEVSHVSELDLSKSISRRTLASPPDAFARIASTKRQPFCCRAGARSSRESDESVRSEVPSRWSRQGGGEGPLPT